MKLLEANEGIETPKTESKMSLNNSKLSSAKPQNGDNSGVTDASSQFFSSKNSAFKSSRSNGLKELEAALSIDEPEGECLEYMEEGHPSFVLAGINNLRKQDKFCDITLVVEDHEMPVHRAILAACSSYLFDFLSTLEATAEQQPIFKLKDVPFVGFHYLVDYMYTGRLHVPVENVPVVYTTSLMLRMQSATAACATFLSHHLTAANCLGIRRIAKDNDFKMTVDDYIRSNLEEIMHSKSFFGLTDLQVEVVGLDEDITNDAMVQRLFSLVLDWAKNNLNDLKPKMDRLVEKVNVLYLESDNVLRDCAEVEDPVLSSDNEIVHDYKILARRRSKTTGKTSITAASTNGKQNQPFHKFSLNPKEAVSVAEREWSVVATHKSSDNAYLAIAILDGHLMAISVHIRSQVPQGSDSNGSNSVPDSPVLTASAKNRLSPVLRKTSIIPLEGMSTARCAMGAVELDGKLMVCGGYDRGECLQTVEAFTTKDNVWTQMPQMKRSRGRISAAVLNSCVYVCGGSDGWSENSCVEKFSPTTGKWEYVASMIKERSSHGVATLNGKLYCVGGCEGQRSIATCEVYDPETNKWSRIASLNTARSQTCVCAANGLLFAIGGTDLWNTLSTVEVYDVEKDEWVMASGLNIARRGAGVDMVNGKMVVVGGSDGTQSLVSSEIYDFETDTWTVGPFLNTPRANLSVVTIGNKLFAVGGFSGKKFLNTLEWLDLEDMEWYGHMPRQDLHDAISSDNLNESREERNAKGGISSSEHKEKINDGGAENLQNKMFQEVEKIAGEEGNEGSSGKEEKDEISS